MIQYLPPMAAKSNFTSKVTVGNVNVLGYTGTVNKTKCEAMKKQTLKALPKKATGSHAARNPKRCPALPARGGFPRRRESRVVGKMRPTRS